VRVASPKTTAASAGQAGWGQAPDACKDEAAGPDQPHKAGRYAERQRSVFVIRDSAYVRGAIGSCCAGGTARSCR
jgi:hypothetical protein